MDYLSSFTCNTYAIVNMVKRRYGPGRNQSSRRGPLIVCGVRESLIRKAVQMGVLKVYTMYIVACADPEWGNGGPDPIPCIITNLSSQHSLSGHHRPASETPFKWRFTGEAIVARLYLLGLLGI